MQRRVLRWYDYSWSHGTIRGVNDVNSLGMMPDSLKVELAIHMNLTTLRKVCFHLRKLYNVIDPYTVQDSALCVPWNVGLEALFSFHIGFCSFSLKEYKMCNISY